MFKTPYSRHARRALLASAAAPVLAAMLAIAPAAAQTADSAVKGARIAASEQINRSAPITADASGTANRIAATGAMETRARRSTTMKSRPRRAAIGPRRT